MNQPDCGGWTALWYAVSEESPELVKALLAAGADHTSQEEDGGTLMEFAVDNDSEEIIELLKAKGAR